MNEPQTASELMMQNQMPKEPSCVLPNENVQKFLLEVIDQAHFQGRMVEFVSQVKVLLQHAHVSGKK